MDRHQTGKLGQTYAIDYLKSQHYAIIEANWHCIGGEIDVVARQGDDWVFVEVRTRHALTTEPALMSITPQKRERLIHSAYMYCHAHDLPDDVPWRIDVVAVALTNTTPLIDHVEDALDWTT